MKTTIFVMLVACIALCSSGASAQVPGSISSQPQMVYVPEHVQHAEQHSLATERPLVGSTDTYSYAQGERPLWEFGPMLPPPTPLGDVARSFRKDKLTAKKAEIVFDKQGS
jgi:hypothetical protein